MGEIIGHKDRQIWTSSNVLLLPSFDHSNKNQKSVENYHRQGSDGIRRPVAPPLKEAFPLNYNTRQRQQNNWQRNKGNEDRMQAFFLISPGSTTSGTGVFLPATAFTPPKKPACSPVLLPARVVQALNLNVHNNGIHISPRSENRENDSKKKSEMVVTSSMDNVVEAPIDSSENSSKISSENSSENFLPEEWIY